MPTTTRRDVFDPTDPADLEPEQRLTGIAAILVAGVMAPGRAIAQPPRFQSKYQTEEPLVIQC